MSTLLSRARVARRGEGGFAMVTVLLSITVMALLGTVVTQLSMHTTERSVHDRARTQAVHAAEAGLDAMLVGFESATTSTLPCNLNGTLSGDQPATWSVAITYYASYPLVGSPMTCGTNGYLGGTTSPRGAQLVSTGSVATNGTVAVERHMQMQVQLTPVHGAFNKAIFSDSAPVINNSVTIYGENGNDADFLTNANWTCSQSLMIYGSIYVQGTANLQNSCRSAVDLWARDSITMSSTSRIDHDVKSSTGSLTMTQSSSVGNNAVVATTCSGCTTGSSGRVRGSVTTGHVQSAPPTPVFPDMAFDAAAWTSAGWTIRYFTDCTTARTWLTTAANSATKAVLRITGGCTLSISQNTTITRTAGLAIFTDGEIETANNTLIKSGDGTWHDLYLIVESAASCAGTDGRITMSNQTSFDRMYFFVYSPCRSTFGQNNSTARGQIYGEVVAAANNLTFTFHPMLVPGAGDVTGYTAGTAFVREIG